MKNTQITLKKGDSVVLRDCCGNLIERKVWEVRDSKVYVMRADQFEKFLKGQPASLPVPFPFDDIATH